MSDVFRRSLSYCLHCLPFLLVLTATLMVVDRVFANSSTNSLTIAHGLLLFFFHQFFLKGADHLTFSGARALRAAGAGSPKMGRFLLVYVGLCLWQIVLVFVLASYDLSLTVVIGVTLLCTFIGFVLFGTLLPHSIEKHPAYRLRAALSASGRVALQIIVGPLLFVIGGFIVLFGLLLLASYTPEPVQDAAGLVVDALAYLSGFVVSAMLAVIFCDTYRQITHSGSDPAPAE